MSGAISTLKSVFSGDTLFFVATFVLIFAYAMYAGRGKLIAFILSFYPATVLFNTFPFVEKLTFLTGDKLISLNQICLFLLFFVPINIVMNRYIFSVTEFDGSNGIVKNALYSLGAMVLIVLFSYSTVSFDSLHNFSGTIDMLFSGTDRLFYWNIVPILLLGVL